MINPESSYEAARRRTGGRPTVRDLVVEQNERKKDAAGLTRFTAPFGPSLLDAGLGGGAQETHRYIPLRSES